MEYNYVIFGIPEMYYLVSYADIDTIDGGRFIAERIDTKNRFLINLYRFHTSPATNRFFTLPFQSVWYPLAFRNTFRNEKPICFVFFTGKRLWEENFARYLRKKYKDCRIVTFFQDLATPQLAEKGCRISDLLISFDQADAEKYDMIYHPLVYSPYKGEEYDDVPESDVYFVGKAKDRLPKILAAYEKLRGAGLHCDFHITGVKPEDRKYADEIDYCASMPYVKNLAHIKKTKCMLEIMQGGGHGYTLRYCEAIMYGKKMLTDNPEIDKAEFYAPARISVFRNADEIDAAFVCREPVSVDYHCKEKLSPIEFLKFIEHSLKENFNEKT